MRHVYILLLAALALTSGCRGVNRLVNGAPDDKPVSTPILSSVPPLGDAPEFNVTTPTGYRRVVFFGALPLDGVVKINAQPDSLIRVFLMQRTIGQWSILNDKYSGAFWYSADMATGTVTYHGEHLDLVAYCVYQYEKI